MELLSVDSFSIPLIQSINKKYHDATAQDVARYRREVKSVYNFEVIPRTKAAQAA